MIARRHFLPLSLLLAMTTVAFADTRQEVTDLAGDMAGALANGDAEGFLTHVAKNMPDRAILRDNLFGLVASADVNTGAEVSELKTEGDRVIVDFDWSMHLVGKEDSAQVEQRHETITLTLEKQGKHWKVIGLKPINFFRSMNIPLK